MDPRLRCLMILYLPARRLLCSAVLDEANFMAANHQRNDERETLEEKRAELAASLETQDHAEETASALLAKINSFVEDFGKLQTRRAKALLQPILQAVNVYPRGSVGGRVSGVREFELHSSHTWKFLATEQLVVDYHIWKEVFERIKARALPRNVQLRHLQWAST